MHRGQGCIGVIHNCHLLGDKIYPPLETPMKKAIILEYSYVMVLFS